MLNKLPCSTENGQIISWKHLSHLYQRNTESSGLATQRSQRMNKNPIVTLIELLQYFLHGTMRIR